MDILPANMIISDIIYTHTKLAGLYCRKYGRYQPLEGEANMGKALADPG